MSLQSLTKEIIEGVTGHIVGDLLFIKERVGDKDVTKLRPAIIRQLQEIRISKGARSKVDEVWVERAVCVLDPAEQAEWRAWRRESLSDDQRKDLSYAYGLMFVEIKKQISDGEAVLALGVSMCDLLKITDRDIRRNEAIAMGFMLPADQYQNLWEKVGEPSWGKIKAHHGEVEKAAEKLTSGLANVNRNLANALAKVKAW